MQRKVKSFNNQKPFRFIQVPRQNHLFLHFSPIQTHPFKSLQQPQKLTFQIQEPNPPPQAKN
uniref:cold shock domain-containing protein n=1 Tax=Bacillus thuringiensis TaxID=1428 RepID=UPI001C930CF0